jgi:hypothetical protein
MIRFALVKSRETGRTVMDIEALMGRTLVPPKYMTRRYWSIIASKALQPNAPISTGNTIRACTDS